MARTLWWGLATVWALGAILQAAEENSAVPQHLRGKPDKLFHRVNNKLVEAPPELTQLAQTYPFFGSKGKTVKGRRITIMAEKTRYKLGETVRIIHVLEAVEQGVELYVMGPKPVFDELLDGQNLNPLPKKTDVYDGKVVKGPAVDFNYDITHLTFTQPGKHTIQWQGGGHTSEGPLGLKSNVLTVEIVE